MAAIEPLERRVLLSVSASTTNAPVPETAFPDPGNLDGAAADYLTSAGLMELIGAANQNNTFLVRAAQPNRVLGYANNFGTVAPLSAVQSVVIYTGNATDTITVTVGVNTPIEVITPDGNTTWLNAGTSTTFVGASGSGSSTSGAGSTGTGTGSTGTGTGSTANGTGSTGTGTGSTGSGTGSTGTGSTGTGSTGTGSTGTGSGSNGTGTGSTGTGTGSTGTGTGSTGSGTGSTGTGSTGTGSTGTGSSGTGSTGTGTGSTGTGTGSTGTGTGSTGTGTGSTGTGTPTTPSNPSDPGTPTPVITVTSPSTVLPQESVNVQAVDSTFGDGTVLNSTIAWNFGEAGSAYNTLVGFNAAHAYANSGTYTITLTITTPDGHVGIATKQITIAPDNRPTIYVSSSGNDGNNGLSAGTPIQSLSRLSQLLTSNMRVLFQAGDTFDMSGGSGIDVGGLSHVYIGPTARAPSRSSCTPGRPPRPR